MKNLCFTTHCSLASPVCSSSLRSQQDDQAWGLELALLNHSSLLVLVICWIQNVEQNENNNSVLFSSFTGSVQLNQEWEAWMGSVSMLDVSLLINELLALFLLFFFMPWSWSILFWNHQVCLLIFAADLLPSSEVYTCLSIPMSASGSPPDSY